MKSNAISGILLTLIYPLAGLVHTLKNLKGQGASTCFYLFCIFWGCALIYYNGHAVLGDGSDTERYVLCLMEAYQNRDISFWDYHQLLGKEDYYSSLLLFIVSRFTDNPHVFFGIASIIMGFFLVKSSWLIIEHCNTNNKMVLIFVYTMLAVAPIWNVGPVRWWTALYVFLYGILSYLIDGKYKKLIWCAVSLLIHFTFLFPLYVVGLYLLLPKKKVFPYLIVYVVAVFIDGLDPSILQNYVSMILPADYNNDTIIGYITFEYKAAHNWFADSGKQVAIYTNLFLALVLYVKCKEQIERNKLYRHFFILSMLVSSMCLIINLAPWGGRFLDLCNFLSMAMYAYLLSDNQIFANSAKLFRFAIPFVVYYMLFQIRGGLYTIGFFNLFMGNMITPFIYNDNTPIIDLVGIDF